MNVVYNASNNELVRTNTLVKGCIVHIEAAPFRAWYLQTYGIELGKKKTDAKPEDKKAEEKKTDAKPEEKKAEAKPEEKKEEKKTYGFIVFSFFISFDFVVFDSHFVFYLY